MTTIASSSNQYDPMYCLSEHLDYFSEAVAGQLCSSSLYNFDDIFGVSSEELALLECAPPAKKQKLCAAPASPKTVMAPFTQAQEETEEREMMTVISSMMDSREAAVVSPTTVTPTATLFYPDIAPSTQSSPRTVVAPIAAAPVQKPKVSRKRTVSETVSTVSPKKSSVKKTTVAKSAGDSSVVSVDREDARRERNRQHAKRSRQRKREFLSQLEESVTALKEENAELMRILDLDATSASTHTIVTDRENEMHLVSEAKFIAALQQPENRVLSDDDMSSLRGLMNA